MHGKEHFDFGGLDTEQWSVDVSELVLDPERPGGVGISIRVWSEVVQPGAGQLDPDGRRRLAEIVSQLFKARVMREGSRCTTPFTVRLRPSGFLPRRISLVARLRPCGGPLMVDFAD